LLDVSSKTRRRSTIWQYFQPYEIIGSEFSRFLDEQKLIKSKLACPKYQLKTTICSK